MPPAAAKQTRLPVATAVAGDVLPEQHEAITAFFSHMGVLQTIKPEHNIKDSFSNLVGGTLKVISIERGKISCLLNVKAPILVHPFMLFYFILNFSVYIVD